MKERPYVGRQAEHRRIYQPIRVVCCGPRATGGSVSCDRYIDSSVRHSLFSYIFTTSGAQQGLPTLSNTMIPSGAKYEIAYWRDLLHEMQVKRRLGSILS